MQRSKRRENLQIAFKLLLGFALVAYVLRSRMIDFQALSGVLFSFKNAVLGFSCLFFIALTCSLRWYLLSVVQGLSLNFFSTFQLTMIGLFFNTFMPGAVGGDLIKAWYVAGREPQRKTKAIFTVILDRAVGLAVFFFFAAITLLFYYQWLQDHEQLRLLAYGIWSFTGGSALIAGAFFFSLSYKLPLSTWIRTQLSKISLANKIFEATLLYRHHARTVLTALLLSTFSIFVSTVLYKLQGDSLGISLSLSQYFFVVPIGLTVSALPLLPGGIGVGQVAFYTLFHWTGMQNPEQGATLCTLIQVYTILFNCIGAFFYVRFRRRPAPLVMA